MGGKTKDLAARHNLDVVHHDNGHIQIQGGYAHVDYWPQSKRRTAYCPQTGARRHQMTPEAAIQMCVDAQPHGKKEAEAKARSQQHAPPPEGMTRREFLNTPGKTNPAGLQFFYAGETPPWDESLGEFQFETETDEMRHRACRHERRALELRIEARDIDQQQRPF